jgi:hypothetical protein
MAKTNDVIAFIVVLFLFSYASSSSKRAYFCGCSNLALTAYLFCPVLSNRYKGTCHSSRTVFAVMFKVIQKSDCLIELSRPSQGSFICCLYKSLDLDD